MRRTVGTLVAAALLAGALWLGARGGGPLPPLGALLDPVHGAWAAARFAGLSREATARIPGLDGPVEVRYDRRAVPHIFATTELDAVRALGYVVARDRLFQLDLQTHAAAGRLTEWVGARALPVDREIRHLGLPRAAEARMAQARTRAHEQAVLDAYSDGVNAWIDGLTRAAWPIEYKLLGVRPERWRPVNSMYLLSRMGWMLASSSDERQRLAAAALVGRDAAAAVLPVNDPIQEPIQPNGRSGVPRYDFAPLAPPGRPDSVAARLVAALPLPGGGDDGRSFASNNWAVAPGRTAAGHALLAGDPHLDLTLPSIWYEAQLVVPGKLDVYGVTIPGAPGIIIGFTRDIAWTFTNTLADVLDLYAETVDDSASPHRYRLDGTWRPLESRVERYLDPRGRTVAVDTVRFSHRGPLLRSGRRWLSMRWTVLDATGSATAFFDAAHATTTRAFLDTMAAEFLAPAQNMLVADRGGHIAIRSTGHYPIRPDSGDGMTIRDGSTSASDWIGFWPVAEYPQSFDPAQGFLASANQQPIDPRVQPRYLTSDKDVEVWRALQINRLLRADSAVTPDAMRRFQTNPGSMRAELFVPFFLNAARSAQASASASPSLDSAAAILEGWDMRYTVDNDRAVLFERALQELASRTWDELTPSDGSRPVRPNLDILLELLHDSTSAWWDDHRTKDVVETRDGILVRSLETAYDDLVRRFGLRSAGGWRWGKVQPARVNHLLRLPGFSLPAIPVQGGPGTLNPSGPSGHGSSWRMVVELGPQLHAWGTYPGGQSGNPASPRYDDRIPLWASGTLDTLFSPADTGGLPMTRTRARLMLRPEGTP